MNMQELQEKYPTGIEVELKGAIYAYPWGGLSFFEGDGNYPKEQGYLKVCEALAKGIVQDFNPVAQAVESIDLQLSKLADEYHAKCANLRDRKAELLQITFDAEVLPADTSHQPAAAYSSDFDDDIPF